MTSLHPDAAEVLAGIQASGALPIRDMTVERARAFGAALPRIVGPGPDVAQVEDHQVAVAGGTVLARVFEAGNTGTTLVHLHGGGWTVGSVEEDDSVCRHLAVAIGGRVVAIGYRRAPEHLFPVPLDDVQAALEWAAARFDGPLVVVGDSAGGNLALSAALEARDSGGPTLHGLVLVHPVVDHVPSPSWDTAGLGGLVEGDDLRWFWDRYVPDRAQRDDPAASPLRAADLGGLPPTLLVTAGHDPLRDDGLALRDRLDAEGTPVEHLHREDLMHGFLPLVNLLAPARETVAAIAAFVAARSPTAEAAR